MQCDNLSYCDHNAEQGITVTQRVVECTQYNLRHDAWAHGVIKIDAVVSNTKNCSQEYKSN